MSEIDDIVSRCRAAAGGVLDLTYLSGSQHAHMHFVAATAAAWWILATTTPPHAVRVSEARQAALHRAGLIDACRTRGIDVEIDANHAGTLGSPSDWSGVVQPAVSSEVVTIADLANPINRPPEPDEHGRRYHWVKSLVSDQQANMDRRSRDLAVSDAARCLYELVDNVHRWARATRGLATVSKSRGGRGSFDRLHIVVMDDGRGIIASVLDDPEARSNLPGDLSEDPAGLLRHFMQLAWGDRAIPKHMGHGLHVSQMLVKHWVGRIDLLSADARTPGTVHHARSTVSNGVEGRPSFHCAGMKGTLASLTLNLTAATHLRDEIVREEEQELQPQLL